MRIGVLISGRGSNLDALLKAKAAGRLAHAQFAVVLSNNPDAPGLRHARDADVPAIVVNHRETGRDRDAHDRRVLEVARNAGCEALVLAGYMRIVGEVLLEAFPGRILNIHPSLLPAFPGLNAPRQALDWGVKIAGCTVHLVDSGVDSGPIILQRPVPVLPDDTEDALAARILEQEHIAIVDALEAFTDGRLRVEERRVRILSESEGNDDA